MAQPEQIPPPAATFRTLRLVYVEVASSDSSRTLIGDLLQFTAREGLRGDNRLRADSHYGYGVSGSTHYRVYHLPHDARKIEAWLAEHGAERVPMLVDGVEVTG